MTKDDVTIRRATLSELDAVWDLIQRAYRGEAAAASWSHEGELPTGERVSCDILAGLIEDAASIFSLAMLGGQIVGTSLVERAAPMGCKIGLLSVDPDFQGHGIGNYLLRCAEHDGANSQGAWLGFVEVLDHKPLLIEYYQRRGYRSTGHSRPYPHQLERPAELLTFGKKLLRSAQPSGRTSNKSGEALTSTILARSMDDYNNQGVSSPPAGEDASPKTPKTPMMPFTE